MRVELPGHVPPALQAEGESPAERLASLLRKYGSVTNTARACGVHRKTVRRWCIRYGVEVVRPQVS